MLSYYLQGYCFGRSGQALTSRLRSRFYEALLRQRVSWFDSAVNSVAKLTTSLSTDCSLVQGMTGIRIGRLVEGLCNLLFSLLVALIYGWKLALVMLLSFPLLAIGAFLEFTLLQSGTGGGGDDDKPGSLFGSSKIIVLNFEKRGLERYTYTTM